MTLVVVYSVQQSAQSPFSKETIKRMTMIVLMVLIINLCSSQWRDCIASLEQPLSLWCCARGTRFACVLFTAAIPSSSQFASSLGRTIFFIQRKQTESLTHSLTLSNPTFHLQISKWERERKSVAVFCSCRFSPSFRENYFRQQSGDWLNEWHSAAAVVTVTLYCHLSLTGLWLGWPTATYNDQQKSTWVSEWVSLSSHVATWWWQSERGRGSRMKSEKKESDEG